MMGKKRLGGVGFSGFTLIELVVVIAIIGVLSGLVVTGVMAARQSVRRVECQNKLRQFGIALASYELTNKHFPSGKTTTQPYDGFSWSAQLLPFLEKEPLWESLTEQNGIAVEDGKSVQRYGLSLFLDSVHCPSNPDTATVQRAMSLSGTYVGLSDYQGVAGRNFRSKDGVFFLDSETAAAEVRAGLSNTIFIGERPPSHDFELGWWFTGFGQDGTGNGDLFLGMEEENAMQSDTVSELPLGPYYYHKGDRREVDSVMHFWSYHQGGANFLYGDGSVVLISYEADRTHMLDLATIDQRRE